jgi:hypothetical protein
MADTSETRTFDEIVSTTLDAYMPTLTDNIHKSCPAFWEFKNKGCYVAATPGVQIVEPLMYGKNETIAGYSRYEVVDVTPQEGITAALFPWSQVAGSITIDGLSEWQNSGRNRVVGLLSAKITQLELSFVEAFCGYLFGAGKYNASQTSKVPAGFLAIISEDPDSYDVGTIDTSVETMWQNKVGDNGGTTWTWTTHASTGVVATDPTGVTKMRQVYNNCSKRAGGAPDLILCSQFMFESYEAHLSPFKRFQNDGAAQAGFDNVKYRGATLYWDEQYASASVSTPASTCGAMFINSKFVKMRYATGKNFSRTPFVRPANQDAKTALVLWYGNTTTSNRGKLGIMADTDLTEIA